MQKLLSSQKVDGSAACGKQSGRTAKGRAGVNAVGVVIFFISLAICSACLFVLVESHPHQMPSPEYEQAAAEMRESLRDAVERIGQTEAPEKLKLDVKNGGYRAVMR